MSTMATSISLIRAYHLDQFKPQASKYQYKLWIMFVTVPYFQLSHSSQMKCKYHE